MVCGIGIPISVEGTSPCLLSPVTGWSIVRLMCGCARVCKASSYRSDSADATNLPLLEENCSNTLTERQIVYEDE